MLVVRAQPKYLEVIGVNLTRSRQIILFASL